MEHYAYEHDLYRLRIRERSPLVGVRRDALDVGSHSGVDVVAVQRGADAVARADDLRQDDVVVVRGDAGAVSAVVVEQYLAVGYGPTGTDRRRRSSGRSSASPRSSSPRGRGWSGRPSSRGWSAPTTG